MASLYRHFDTDQEKERDGVWLTLGEAGFKLARAGGANETFVRSFEERIAPHLKEIAAGTLTRDRDRRIMVETFAEAVLRDWRGVTDRSGQPLPFTYENAVILLLDLPELFAHLYREATTLARFKAEERAEVKKNSPSGSHGSLPGHPGAGNSRH